MGEIIQFPLARRHKAAEPESPKTAQAEPRYVIVAQADHARRLMEGGVRALRRRGLRAWVRQIEGPVGGGELCWSVIARLEDEEQAKAAFDKYMERTKIGPD